MKIDYHDKLKGMFVGLAVGDMLGMPLEFKDPSDFKPITEPIGGGSHDLPIGYWTDDTSMALCLSDSILEQQGYNSYDVMNKYWLWRSQGYRSSTGKCFDIGNQTSEAINQYISTGGFVPADTPTTTNAGNGCIMRLAPVIIAAYEQRKPADIIKLAKLSARETHNSLEAMIATELFANLLIKAVEGKNKTEILHYQKPKPTDRFVAYDEDVSINGQPPPKHTYRTVSRQVMPAQDFDKKQLKNEGYIIHSLQVAVWAFNKYYSFKDGALAVANLGGDSDTNCAIYGQLAGAYYGYKAIPSEWSKVLLMEKEVAELADKLIEMPSCSIVVTRFQADYLS